MKRFTILSAAALLTCCGMSLGQEGMKDTQPDKDAPKATEAAKPKQPESRKLLAVGDAAPALSIDKWVKGEPVTGFEKGRVYLVEFWATWCGPCKASMPHITEIQKEYKSKGLTVIGVSSPGWRDKLDDVEKMVKDKADVMGYTVAWDKEVASSRKGPDGEPMKDGATNIAYMTAARQRGIPTSFVVDQKGNIAWIGHPSQLDFVIDDVMAGKWDYVEGPKKLAKIDEEREKIMEDAQSDPKAALKALASFEEKYPKAASSLVSTKYTLQMEAGQYAEAGKTGEKLVDQMVAQKNGEMLNAFAWNLVDPEGEIKGKHNVDLAMRAARKAVELTSEKNAAILDTLARCYWIKGDKAKAVELQKKAVASLSKDEDEGEMGDQIRKTLKEYEGGSN